MTGAEDGAAGSEDRAPSTGSHDLEAELDQARRRIEELEAAEVAADSRVSLAQRELSVLSKRIVDLQDRLEASIRLAKRLAARAGWLRRRSVFRTVMFLASVFRRARRVATWPVRRLRRTLTHHGTREQRVADKIRALRSGPHRTSGPTVSIIVLTRDGRHHMERLLDGLSRRTAYRSFELIVVDNGSSDGTDALLHRAWPFPIHVIRNEQNTTFSAGNNQGLTAARGDLILFLNNDVDPINESWLGAMVDAMLADERRVALGALLVYPPRTGQPSGERAPRGLRVQHRGVGFYWDEGAPRARNLGVGENPTAAHLVETRPVPAATAACLLVGRQRLEAVGGFAGGYVYGAEDVDLCLKLLADGGEIAVCGEAALFHHEFGTQDLMESEIKAENRRRNWRLFAQRWAPTLSRSIRLDQLRAAGWWTGRSERVVAITLTKDDPDAGWGDYFTAHELGEAFSSEGWRVIYAEAHLDGWYNLEEDVDLLIVLLDRFDVRKAPPGAYTVAWVRNWTDRWLARPWFDRYDLVVASSERSAEIVRRGSQHEPEILPLAVDPGLFHPGPLNPDLACDFTFAGNNWGTGRRLIDVLEVRPGERFALYGRGWEEVEGAAEHHRGFIEFSRLPDLYRSGKIVIDDTAEHTLPYAAMNSRVFEALACGTLVLTNNVEGSRELFGGELPSYTSAEELRALLDRYLADDEARRRTAGRLRRVVLEQHTYALRARQFVELAEKTIMKPKVAIKIASSNERVAESWGDTHFARDFARSLRKLGFTTRIDLRVDWDDRARQDADVVLQLRGLHVYKPQAAHLNYMWLISHPDDLGAEEAEEFDGLFVASSVFADELRRTLTVPVSVLYQAADTEQFRPVTPDPELRCGVLFVGNARRDFRPSVKWAIELGAPLRIYGARWGAVIPEEFVVAEYFPNEQLHQLYRSADIVLSDHWEDMRANGFISNRIFDALACGAFVISDAVVGMDEVLDGAVPMFQTKEELGALLDKFLSDPDARERLALTGMEVVREHHSFDARARHFADAIAKQLARRPRTIEQMRPVEATEASEIWTAAEIPG